MFPVVCGWLLESQASASADAAAEHLSIATTDADLAEAARVVGVFSPTTTHERP